MSSRARLNVPYVVVWNFEVVVAELALPNL